MAENAFDEYGSYTGEPGDDEIVATAQRRLKRGLDWEAEFRKTFTDDMKFAYGDPDNGWQWPNEQWLNAAAGPESRPRLTINKVRQHNLQIKNEAKQNKAGITMRPTGGEATYEAAQVFEGLVRAIERNSRADQAYSTAFGFCVDGGIGYVRLVTDYVSDLSFDQDAYIRRIKDPLTVVLDPDINEVDGSDAAWGIVYDDVPPEEFYNEYPKLKGKIGQVALPLLGEWVTKDYVRVAEYFYKVDKHDTLISYYDESGEQQTALKSKLPKNVAEAILADKMTRTRPVIDQSFMWCKIAGDKVVSKSPWLGKYVPIARCVGDEVIIERKLHRAGHTRSMKDAQRMYNYWTSSAVEHVAYQTKTRWFLPVGASDNFEEYYQNFNQRTTPFLPWNAVNEDGSPLPPPIPIEPPTMAEAYIKGMMIAKEELMMASGQYQSQFGQNENATSGRAINERQRQGENSTYHWIDGQAIMLRHVGNMLKDLITKLYDTMRVVRILARDGKEQRVQIDPMMKQASKTADEALQAKKVAMIFNPRIGEYGVESDVGPSYATQRQEAFNAMTQIIAQNEGLATIIGDLLFKNADFPGADEISERLLRMVPPAALGEGPTPEMAALKGQNDNLQKLLAETLEKMAEAERKAKDRETELRRENFDAMSKRITALSNAEPELGPDKIKQLVDEMLKQALAAGDPTGKAGGVKPDASTLGPSEPQGPSDADGEGETGGDVAETGEEPPLHGAKRAPDGFWYVPDTKRKGKWMRVHEEA